MQDRPSKEDLYGYERSLLCEENRTSDQETTLEVLHLVSADVRLRVMDDKQNDAEASRSC